MTNAYLPEVPGVGVNGEGKVLLEQVEEVAVSCSVHVEGSVDVDAASEVARSSE